MSKDETVKKGSRTMKKKDGDMINSNGKMGNK